MSLHTAIATCALDAQNKFLVEIRKPVVVHAVHCMYALILLESFKFVGVVLCFLCSADLDPIYYCELLKACEVKDDGDAKINSVTVKPNQFARGALLYESHLSKDVFVILHVLYVLC